MKYICIILTIILVKMGLCYADVEEKHPFHDIRKHFIGGMETVVYVLKSRYPELPGIPEMEEGDIMKTEIMRLVSWSYIAREFKGGSYKSTMGYDIHRYKGFWKVKELWVPRVINVSVDDGRGVIKEKSDDYLNHKYIIGKNWWEQKIEEEDLLSVKTKNTVGG